METHNWEEFEAVLAENRRRIEARVDDYDPALGVGCCGERIFAKWGSATARLPIGMLADKAYVEGADDIDAQRLRCRYDFEFWAYSCVKIHDKTTGRMIPFRLNRPQRRVVALLESQRVADEPIRLIMLKARQWGGSTLVQVYMAWIQCVHRENWHSLICAHVKDTATSIRYMYDMLLDYYPEELWEGSEPPAFRPLGRSQNTRKIAGRGCHVTLGSAENHDAVRGCDYAMAHLSEVAFWKSTPSAEPADFVRAVCGAINSTPLTMIVMESTANGTGNYFHDEWLRSERGESDKIPVFVPWHEIEIYRRKVTDAKKLWDSMDPYERALWEKGLTLEQICWYHYKRKEYRAHRQMQAEYPSNPLEAFSATDNGVFAPEEVERMRRSCHEPIAVGDVQGNGCKGVDSLDGLKFAPSEQGQLKVWNFPDEGDTAGRYVVSVDVGGRSASSDWSVISVFDTRGGERGDMPEVVAQWRGHTDHDLLAWHAAAIARFYGEALLVPESNTFETSNIDGDPAQYILTEISGYYRNLYYRPRSDGDGQRIGFHTNRSTKSMIINRMIATVRVGGYVEHDDLALNEMLTYQVLPSGTYGAKPGCHDDILMTRAIALEVIAGMRQQIERPKIEDYIGTYVW